MSTMARSIIRATVETRAGGDYDPPAPVPAWQFQVTAPLLIGFQLSVLLLGIVLAVSWGYFRRYRADSKWRKALVVQTWADGQLLLLLTTTETALQSSRITRWVSVYGGDYTVSANISEFPEVWLAILTGLVTGSVCELFMVVRVVRFARAMRPARGRAYAAAMWLMTVVLALGATFNLLVGDVVLPLVMGSFLQLTSVESGQGHDFGRATMLQLGGSVAMDVLVTLVTSIQYRKAKTGFGASNSVLDSLATICMRNGALVLLIQTAQMVANAITHTTWGFLPYYILAKIRVLSVLAIIVAPRDALDAFYQHQDTVLAGPDSALAADVRAGGAAPSTPTASRGWQPHPPSPSPSHMRELVLPTMLAQQGTGRSQVSPSPSKSFDLARDEKFPPLPATPTRSRPPLAVDFSRAPGTDGLDAGSFRTINSGAPLLRTESESTLDHAEKGDAISLRDMLRDM